MKPGIILPTDVSAEIQLERAQEALDRAGRLNALLDTQVRQLMDEVKVLRARLRAAGVDERIVRAPGLDRKKRREQQRREQKVARRAEREAARAGDVALDPEGGSQ